jgi:phage tail-like protein
MSFVPGRLFLTRWFFVSLVALFAVYALGRIVSASSDEQRRYTFVVTVNGIITGTFREVSGLDIETEVIEYRDGSGGPVQYFPGVTKYSSIKLERTFTGDSTLYDWYAAFAQTGTPPRASGTIAIQDAARNEVARWNFTNAWPSKYSGPTLKGDRNDIAVESIVLTHEGISWVRP